MEAVGPPPRPPRVPVRVRCKSPSESAVPVRVPRVPCPGVPVSLSISRRVGSLSVGFLSVGTEAVWADFKVTAQ